MHPQPVERRLLGELHDHRVGDEHAERRPFRYFADFKGEGLRADVRAGRARDLLPLGSAGLEDLSYALDDRFQDGVAEPATIAAVARLLGVDTIWLAGGGIRGGHTHGATDEFSYNVAEDGVWVRDLHATLLHCLGIDHSRFSHRFRGLNVRLTGVEQAHVVHDILL